jgi:replication-associated recombination protein RarA
MTILNSQRNAGKGKQNIDSNSSCQSASAVSLDTMSAPLAEQVRPKDLTTFVGQDKVVGQNSILRSLLKEGEVTSMILWGPPGCGKVNEIIGNNFHVQSF